MKKLCFIIPIIIISVMLLGCFGGKKQEAVVETAIPETVTEVGVTGSIQNIDRGEPVENTQLSEVERDVLLPLPYDSSVFWFSSGAGGWSTHIELNSDGSFSGNYSDSNMGDTGPDNPNGTVYTCEFSGKFGNITKVNDYSYKMTLTEINIENTPGDEWIEDDTKYIATGPYGIEDGEEFIFYLPNTPVDILDETFLSWWPYRYDGYQDTLDCYGFLNVNTGDGFFNTY